jgi:hypothetical protein
MASYREYAGILRPGRDHMVEVLCIHGTEGTEAEPVAVSRNSRLHTARLLIVCADRR